MEVWDPGPASAVSLILSQDDEHDDDAGGDDDDQDDVGGDNESLLMAVVKDEALSLLKTTRLRTIQEELKPERVSLNRRYIYLVKGKSTNLSLLV